MWKVEVYRGIGCVIGSRACPRPYWHSVSTPPHRPHPQPLPPISMPKGLDFSPTYFNTTYVCYLHCGHRKTGRRSSIMCLPCFSLEEQASVQGLGTDLKYGDLSKIVCSSSNRHACSWAPKNATHWCCGLKKSPPSVPVFSWKFYVGHQMLS